MSIVIRDDGTVAISTGDITVVDTGAGVVISRYGVDLHRAAAAREAAVREAARRGTAVRIIPVSPEEAYRTALQAARRYGDEKAARIILKYWRKAKRA